MTCGRTPCSIIWHPTLKLVRMEWSKWIPLIQYSFFLLSPTKKNKSSECVYWSLVVLIELWSFLRYSYIQAYFFSLPPGSFPLPKINLKISEKMVKSNNELFKDVTWTQQQRPYLSAVTLAWPGSWKGRNLLGVFSFTFTFCTNQYEQRVRRKEVCAENRKLVCGNSVCFKLIKVSVQYNTTLFIRTKHNLHKVLESSPFSSYKMTPNS